MMRAGPCPVWPEHGKMVLCFACRSMHAIHAQLFIKRLARKKGLIKKKDRYKKAAGWTAAVRISKPGGMLSRNGLASDVLLPVPVVLPVRFPAVAAR